ncbi:MAG: hypothetical protein L7U87_08175 [Chlamydiales bacterium]|nr:hypothetical protein [Chlamydiales bacterium]
MMYTKKMFAQDLKNKIAQKQSTISIGEWAYTIYLNWDDAHDANFLNLLIHLNTMKLGEEFAFTYEELGKIADDLISGKEPDL